MRSCGSTKPWGCSGSDRARPASRCERPTAAWSATTIPISTRPTDATRRTAELTEAYALVQRKLATSPDGRIEHPRRAPRLRRRPSPVPVKEVDGDSILFDVPADEAFAALFEAAGRVGHVAYFDRHLGILETVVRFEGGPSCSVLITLQGRAYGTEAFCTMESIEAAPTPPIGRSSTR